MVAINIMNERKLKSSVSLPSTPYFGSNQTKAPSCNKYWSNNQFNGTVTAKTKITAAPKPTAVVTFFDTAK